MSDLLSRVVKTSFGVFPENSVVVYGHLPSVQISLGRGYPTTLVLDGENIGEALMRELLQHRGEEAEITFGTAPWPIGTRVQPFRTIWNTERRASNRLLQVYVGDLPIITLTGCNWFVLANRLRSVVTGTWLEREGGY